MTKRKVLSIIGLCLTALLIVCLFIPFISDGDTSFSLWKIMDNQDRMAVNIIMLVELIIAILIFVLQICGVLKDAKFTYFTLGYYVTAFLDTFISMMKQDFFKYLSIGFYFGFIISIATLVIVIIGSALSDEKKPSYNQKPVGYDPQTGKPIYEAPKQLVGYDPQTGQPIYK